MPAPSPPARAPRRTRAEAAEFYEHLVQTSLQLFAEGGYEAIAMRRLAAEVGVPPMTLYRYFPTKAHLMRHIWSHILDEACERCAGVLTVGRPPLQRLRDYVDGFLGYWLEHREHYWVVFAIRDTVADHGAGEPGQAISPNPQRFLQTLALLIDEHLASHPPLPPSRRREAVDLMFCKVLGFLLGPIGLAALRWSDLQTLKSHLLDDIVEQVRRLAPARRRPAGLPDGGRAATQR